MTKRYSPKTRDELVELVERCERGEAWLGEIDVSRVTDMRWLFTYRDGIDWEDPRNDITGWDVSRVRTMYAMFAGSAFDQDISAWCVDFVRDMRSMFYEASFSRDLFPWFLHLRADCRLYDFNRQAPQEKRFGTVDGYDAFVRAFVSERKCRQVYESGSDKDRYLLLKALKNLEKENGFSMMKKMVDESYEV